MAAARVLLRAASRSLTRAASTQHYTTQPLINYAREEGTNTTREALWITTRRPNTAVLSLRMISNEATTTTTTTKTTTTSTTKTTPRQVVMSKVQALKPFKLVVSFSNKFVYACVIDTPKGNGVLLAAASSMEKTLR